MINGPAIATPGNSYWYGALSANSSGVLHGQKSGGPALMRIGLNVDSVLFMTDSSAYRKALAERSSYVENILIHRLVSGLASELWCRNPNVPLHIFNSEVDDAGFDLVLACGDRLRYIQVKQVHTKGAASKFSVRLEFTRLPGSCVVVVVHSESDLAVEHHLFFGGAANEPMPNVENEKTSVSPIKRGEDGKKKVRLHYRDIPRKKFTGPLNTGELLDALFS